MSPLKRPNNPVDENKSIMLSPFLRAREKRTSLANPVMLLTQETLAPFDVENIAMFHRISYQTGGEGFLPSTVSLAIRVAPAGSSPPDTDPFILGTMALHFIAIGSGPILYSTLTYPPPEMACVMIRAYLTIGSLTNHFAKNPDPFPRLE